MHPSLIRGVARALAGAVLITTMATAVACAPVDTDQTSGDLDGARPTPTMSPPEATVEPRPTGGSSSSAGRSIPVDAPCDVLVDGETVYALNPNLGPDPDHTPSALAALVVDSRGVSCGWINQTSGVTVSASVAAFDADGVTAVRQAANNRGGSPFDLGSSGEGVFRSEQSVGVIELFRAPYWIVIESPVFASADEAELVIEAMTRALP